MEKELTVKGLSLKKETDEIATALAKKIATLTFEYNDVLLKARVSEEEADKFERWLRLAQKNEETTKAYYKSELTTAHLTINSQVKEIAGLKEELAEEEESFKHYMSIVKQARGSIDAAFPGNKREGIIAKAEYLIDTVNNRNAEAESYRKLYNEAKTASECYKAFEDSPEGHKSVIVFLKVNRELACRYSDMIDMLNKSKHGRDFIKRAKKAFDDKERERGNS
jgi:hypothetical protein